jgi:hypothetical protein
MSFMTIEIDENCLIKNDLLFSTWSDNYKCMNFDEYLCQGFFFKENFAESKYTPRSKKVVNATLIRSDAGFFISQIFALHFW